MKTSWNIFTPPYGLLTERFTADFRVHLLHRYAMIKAEDVAGSPFNASYCRKRLPPIYSMQYALNRQGLLNVKLEKTKIHTLSMTDLIDYGKFLLLAGIAVWLAATTVKGMDYTWHWYRVPQFLFSSDGVGPLIEGLLVTLEISSLSLLLTLFLGLTTALLSLSHSFTARALARGYLELIRNTPLLIQIFFVYFVLSPVLDIGAFASAILALSLFEGSYTAEILRSGIASLPRGQWEAAHSLGLGTRDAYIKVILPQAIRRVLPPLAGQIISLVKDSSLVSTIAIYDLTMQGQRIVSETFLAFEIWFTVAGIYLVITFTLSMAVRRIERRINKNHFWWNGSSPQS